VTEREEDKIEKIEGRMVNELEKKSNFISHFASEWDSMRHPRSGHAKPRCQAVPVSASDNLALFNNDPTQIMGAYLLVESFAGVPREKAISQCPNR
jgi:hypothetical protein